MHDFLLVVFGNMHLYIYICTCMYVWRYQIYFGQLVQHIVITYISL